MSRLKKDMSKMIIILLLICLVTLVILVSFLSKQYKTKRYEESIAEFQEFREKYEAETILARNPTVIFGYDGEYDRDYLYRDMKKFADYMYYLKDNVTSQNLDEFYSKYSADIAEYLGITNKDEFIKFIEELEKKEISEEKFRYAEFVKGSIGNTKEYFSFKINFYYGEDSEDGHKVVFLVNFANYKYLDIDVKYEFYK